MNYWIRSHICYHVSRDLLPGAKMVYIFEIPDPNLPFHFVTFMLLAKSGFPIVKSTKFTAHAQYHVTWA